MASGQAKGNDDEVDDSHVQVIPQILMKQGLKHSGKSDGRTSLNWILYVNVLQNA